MNMWKMKHYGYIALLSLSTFMTTGCSQSTEGEVIPPSGNRQIRLQLAVQNDLQARTALENSKNVQNVTSVQLYIFDGEEPDSKCILSQPVDWTDMPTGEISAQKIYTIEAENLPSQPCLLMAVGMDKEAQTAYGLPATITLGTTLNEAKAKLADGQSYTAIAQAPVFSGTATATPGVTEAVSITMNRRIAGVLCYLDHIPVSILKEDGNYTRLKQMQLVLSQNQNTSVSLKKQDTNDYGSDQSTEASSRVLVNFAIDDIDAIPSIEGNYYKFPNGTSGNVQLWTTRVLQGVFVLPLEEVTGQATLSLQAFEEGNPSPIRTWQLTNNTSPTYPLEANSLYRIGNDIEDIPLDLLEDEIILIPDYEMIHEGKSE